MDELSSPDHPDWWRPMGGQNSQDSTLERRSMIWNDGEPVAPAGPPALRTGIKDVGKFFTRGCRGKIHALQVYCIRTAAGTLDLSFSPHPCIGPLYTVTVTPGAAWAWALVPFQEMWNYDSLFVWVSRCDADVSYGRDNVQPHDQHTTLDGGATWTRAAWRPYIRALYDGETPGDVPVSGILNVIPIPNHSSSMDSANLPIPHNVITDFFSIYGAGKMIRVLFRPSVSRVTLYIDIEGQGAAYRRFAYSPFTMNAQGFNDDTPMIQVLMYNEDAGCVMQVTIPFEFRREIHFRAHQTTGVAQSAVLTYNLLMMR